MGLFDSLVSGVGNFLWPQNPAPGEMSPLQRVGYATAGPQGLQRAMGDVGAQISHDAVWAQQHPEEFAQHAALAFGGADVTADVPGGISGRARLGEDQSGGDMYRHYPVLDDAGRQVGYLDAHQTTGPNGKQMVHVDMLSVRGGHNLLPIFRQMRDLFPEAEGVLAQRISGLGNTAGYERTYMWPRAFREPGTATGPGKGPSFTGMTEAAQTAGAKQELAGVAAGAPSAPGAPSRPSFTGPQAAEPTQADLGQAMSGIMMTPGPDPSADPLELREAREARAYQPGDTFQRWVARNHPDLSSGPGTPDRLQRFDAARQEYQAQRRAAGGAASVSPDLLAQRQVEFAGHVRRSGETRTFDRWYGANYPDEYRRWTWSAPAAGAPLATTAGPRPNLPHWSEWVASAPYRSRGTTYANWLARRYPEEAAGGPSSTSPAGTEAPGLRQYGPTPAEEQAGYRAQSARREALRQERLRQEGRTSSYTQEPIPARPEARPHFEEYQRSGAIFTPYSEWLAQHYPARARGRTATPPGASPGPETEGQPQDTYVQGEGYSVRTMPPAPPTAAPPAGAQPSTPVQAGAGALPPLSGVSAGRPPEYSDPSRRPSPAYADWLTQHYPDEVRQRYGGVNVSGQRSPEEIRGAIREGLARTAPPATQPSFTGPRPVADFRRGEGFQQWMRRTHPEREMPNDAIRQEYDRLRVREWRQRSRQAGQNIASRMREAQTRQGEAVAAPSRPAPASANEEAARRIAALGQRGAAPSGEVVGPPTGYRPSFTAPATDLPHREEYFQTSTGSYPDWLREHYPDEAEARYGPATQRPGVPPPPTYVNRAASGASSAPAGGTFTGPARPNVGPESTAFGGTVAPTPSMPSEPIEQWYARTHPGEEPIARVPRERLLALIQEWGRTAQPTMVTPPGQ